MSPAQSVPAWEGTPHFKLSRTACRWRSTCTRLCACSAPRRGPLQGNEERSTPPPSETHPRHEIAPREDEQQRELPVPRGVLAVDLQCRPRGNTVRRYRA